MGSCRTFSSIFLQSQVNHTDKAFVFLLACAYDRTQHCSTAAAHLKYLFPRASTPTSSLLRNSLLKAADALVNKPPRSAMFVKRLLEHQNCCKVLRADHCQACMLNSPAYKSLELSFILWCRYPIYTGQLLSDTAADAALISSMHSGKQQSADS